MMAEDVDICAFCLHPVADHGTTEIGCAVCSCGFDGDWHGDD